LVPSQHSWPHRSVPDRSVPISLSQEFKTFRDQLPALLEQHAGEFALVFGSQAIAFPSHAAAVEAGLDQYGKNAFLVKRIDPVQQDSTEVVLSLVENS
jgi:hypothetical protein